MNESSAPSAPIGLNNEESPPFSLETFRKQAAATKAERGLLVSHLVDCAEAITPSLLQTTEAAVWQSVDCLACAGCCRHMSPELDAADVKRIASFLRLSPKVFAAQYLQPLQEPNRWVMNGQPCPLLNMADNSCRVYAVRPADCAGFPHLSRHPFADYAHMHGANQQQCPATALMVDKLMAALPSNT